MLCLRCAVVVGGRGAAGGDRPARTGSRARAPATPLLPLLGVLCVLLACGVGVCASTSTDLRQSTLPCTSQETSKQRDCEAFEIEMRTDLLDMRSDHEAERLIAAYGCESTTLDKVDNCCVDKYLLSHLNGIVGNAFCLPEPADACLDGFFNPRTDDVVASANEGIQLQTEAPYPTNGRTASTVATCPAGYFCPAGVTCAVPCLLGGYCPSNPNIYGFPRADTTPAIEKEITEVKECGLRYFALITYVKQVLGNDTTFRSSQLQSTLSGGSLSIEELLRFLNRTSSRDPASSSSSSSTSGRRRRAGDGSSSDTDASPESQAKQKASSIAQDFYNGLSGSDRELIDQLLGNASAVAGKQLVPFQTLSNETFSKLFSRVNGSITSPEIERLVKVTCCETGAVPLLSPEIIYPGICPGSSADSFCPAGRYCPSTNESIVCPARHYCRQGSYEPTPCNFLTVCKTGSSTPFADGSGILVLVIVVALFWLIFYSIQAGHLQHIWARVKGAANVCLGRNTATLSSNSSEWANQVAASRAMKLTVTALESPLLGPDGEQYLAMQDLQASEEWAAPDNRETDTARLLPEGGSDDLSSRRDSTATDRTFEVTTSRPVHRCEPPLDIEFCNLCLTLRGPSEGKVILSGLTGGFRSGQVSAIMGPSGAGKTSAMSAICGKADAYGNVSGEILVNGRPGGVGPYRSVLGFVPQDDIMPTTLTVKDVLFYNALLRLPAGWSRAERYAKVVEVLSLLDLTAIADSIIGDEKRRGISGGQRKRVNIGCELVAEPSLLFLDEPTSGLDSTSSLVVLKALRQLATEGRMTIVSVLHQPRYEVYSLFDTVLLLGKGGVTVYLGPSAKALSYFESLGFELPLHVNPPDFFLDCIAGEAQPANGKALATVDFAERWRAHCAQRQIEGGEDGTVSEMTDEAGYRRPFDPVVKPGFLAQTSAQLQRWAKIMLADWKGKLLDLVLVWIGGGFLGCIYLNVNIESTESETTFSALIFGLTTAVAALRVFSNKPVFWRETAAGVSRSAYFLAGNLVEVPILLLQPIIYLSLLHSLSASRADLGSLYAVYLSTGFATSGLAYFMGILLDGNALMSTVVAVLLSAMLSGSSPTIPTLNKLKGLGPLLYSISYARYQTEAVFLYEVDALPPVYAPLTYAAFQRLGYHRDDLGMCFGALVAYGVGFRLLALLALVLKDRGKQK